MSDDEADPELLELLRQSLGISTSDPEEVSSDTGVLASAKYVYDNAIDVSIDMLGTKAAAASIYKAMQERQYSTETWALHELHPTPAEGFAEVDLINFVFTMDLLNFSFWSEHGKEARFQVEYRGQRWTGYNSLVACLRRALDDGVPITTPSFWTERAATDEALRSVFNSANADEIPLLGERVQILREAAEVLHDNFRDPADLREEQVHVPPEPISTDAHQSELPIQASTERLEVPSANDAEIAVAEVQADRVIRLSSEQDQGELHDHTSNADSNGVIANTASGLPDEASPGAAAEQVFAGEASTVPLKPDVSVLRLIEQANGSAGKLVNLMAKHFPCFRDETRFDGHRVRLLKRAQIFVADLWAALNGRGYGEFHDIGQLTMFADYRVPQMLYTLGVISYSPPLDHHIRSLKQIAAGHSWEVQIRGCSIWAVELIRQEILRAHPDTEVNAVLVDFFLYDLAKERERGHGGLAFPHHRTRSVWY